MTDVELPAVNSPVQVQTELGPLPSRVEDHGADELVLAAPLGTPVTYLPSPAEDLVLSWTGPRGVQLLPVRLTEVVPGQIRLWRVRVAGRSRVVQRRDFVRCAINLPAVVTRDVPAPRAEVAEPAAEPAELPVTVIDLSEGGIGCAVPAAEAGQLTTGAGVAIRFDLGTTTVLAPATVVRTDAAAGDRVRVGLRLSPTDAQAAAIRGFVLARQRELRARGLPL